MSADDLENFEADRELQLAQEYQDVTAMFRFAVETERRFYLANVVAVNVASPPLPPPLHPPMKHPCRCHTKQYGIAPARW